MIERTFVQQGLRRVEMEKYLKKELGRAGFTKAEIIKTPMVTRIVVNVVNPGLAIGKSGANIKSLTDLIEKRFKIDNPQLEIKQIEKPELDAQAQADKMKSLLERGFSWRSVAYKTVKEITGANAQGVELILKGKLAGKGGRKRKQRIAEGYMKKVGHQAKLVDVGQASAYPKAGAIGIKISIVRPGVVFPDKVSFPELLEERILNETEAKPETPAETTEVKEAKPAETTEAKETTEKVEPKKEPKPKAEEKKEVKKEVKKEAKKEVKKEAKKEEKPEAKKEEKKEEKPAAKGEKKEVKTEKPKEEKPKAEEKKAEPKAEEKPKEEVKEEKKEMKEEKPQAAEKLAEEKPAEKAEEKPVEKTEEKVEEKKSEA